MGVWAREIHTPLTASSCCRSHCAQGHSQARWAMVRLSTNWAQPPAPCSQNPQCGGRRLGSSINSAADSLRDAGTVLAFSGPYFPSVMRVRQEYPSRPKSLYDKEKVNQHRREMLNSSDSWKHSPNETVATTLEGIQVGHGVISTPFACALMTQRSVH